MDTTTAKKARLKNSRFRGTSAITAKVASTTGTPPRSPAQPSASRSRAVKSSKIVASAAATGRATTTTTSASTVPSKATSPRSLGNTSSPKREEEPDLGHPGQPLVEHDDRVPGRDGRAAEHEAGQVDGEEARAVSEVGGAEGERAGGDRRDRIKPPGGEAHTPEGPHGREADAQAAHRADAHLLDEEQAHVEYPVVRPLDPLDEPDHEEDRHRVVEPGLGLEGSGQAATQRGPAEQREDRGAVGGGQRGPHEKPLEGREVEQPNGAERRDGRGDDGSYHRQHQPRPEHRPDLAEARRQPALEEDRGQGDHAQTLGELVVVEIDPAGAVGPEQHAETEEEKEARHAQAARQQGRGERRREQSTGDEDELAVAHREPSLLRRATRQKLPTRRKRTGSPGRCGIPPARPCRAGPRRRILRGMRPFIVYRDRISAGLAAGLTLAELEDQVLRTAALDEDQKAALWLFGFALAARRA